MGAKKAKGPKVSSSQAGKWNLEAEAKRAREQSEAERTQATDRSRFAQQATQGLITQLQGQAAGTAPSLAEAQLKSATNRNLSQQLAAAASQRGGGPSQARQLARQQGQAGRELAESAAQARLQEQAQAQQLLASTSGQEQQLADSLTQRYIQMGYDFDTASKKSQQELIMFLKSGRAAAQQANASGGNAMTGSLIGGAATVGASYLSDKTKKKNVKSAKKEIDSFLDALSAREYEYKEPGDIVDKHLNVSAPEGRQVGIMAQDLEKSKAGKQMVDETPYGKVVNPVKGFGAVLAAQSEIHKRVKKLEKRRG